MREKLQRMAHGAVLALSQVIAMCALAPVVHAQGTDYPNKPVKFIVPFPAGGSADVMARLIAMHLQAKWGQPFVIDNRPGAGSALGMDVLAKAAPNGYTIGLGNIAANAINPAVRPAGFPYQPAKDFAAISLVAVAPVVLVINPQKVPVNTLPEFIAFLKANPGKLSFGSSGVGSSLQLAMEIFLLRTGTTMVHVPYKGSSPMISDLLGGQIDAAMDSATTSMPHVKIGKLRALGVSTKERAFFAPDLAPIADTVPGFEMRSWHGVMAPAGTPLAIVNKLSEEIQAFLRQPEAEAQLREAGLVRVVGARLLPVCWPEARRENLPPSLGRGVV